MKKTVTFITMVFSLSTFIAVGQNTTDSLQSKAIYDLSLEELMNIKIVSASKTEETVFEAPLSSYTITHSDIEKSGVTSIMEALRLAPGVIVREMSNGVYDIHIRGLDNILRNDAPPTKTSNTILVMIDNRPVFNYNFGGTFWEGLPVDLNDVDRIEVVRGPSSPLFGPNAVTGVINIMTKRATNANNTVYANVQYGTPETFIGNASLGRKIGKKLSLLVSGNFQNRQRFDNNYFSVATKQLVSADKLFSSDSDPDDAAQAANRYPHQSQALHKWGANAFLTFKAAEKINFDLSLGTQKAETQKVFGTSPNGSVLTYLTASNTQSYYSNLQATIHNLSIRASLVNARDYITVGFPGSNYDNSNVDVTAEYSMKLKDKLVITPGVYFQDVNYKTLAPSLSSIPENSGITTYSAFVRSDFHLHENWRVLLAVRTDKFSTYKDPLLAAELASTFKINSKHLIRFAFNQAHNSSFIFPSYLNVSIPLPDGSFRTLRGSQDNKLPSVRGIEVGYRVQLTDNLQMDMDVFSQFYNNLNALITTSYSTSPLFPPNTPQALQISALPINATQNGVTLSLNYVPNNRIQVKPFLTYQHTETKDLPNKFVAPEIDASVTYSNQEHKSTPNVYGGFYLNYQPIQKLTINFNGYYFSSHHQYDATEAQGIDLGSISAKLIASSKVSYNVTNDLNVYINLRNALNSKSREYFGTDITGALYMVGANFKLNP